MTQHTTQLMDRLTAYQPGGADAELLLQRLQHEHDWTRAAALAATEEYRRFLYLAVTCPHPVTPSPIVDAVWHEHLMFTREYREELCAGVLGRTLDHTPGGADKTAQHHQQYLDTLDAYADAFGSAAPTGTWPDPRVNQDLPATEQRSQTPLRTALVVAITALALGMMFMTLQFFIQDVTSTLTILLLTSILILPMVILGHHTSSPSVAQRQNGSSGSSGSSSGGSCSGASCASSCGSGCGGGGCGS
ncbi:hypothetical protein [Deinococcus soli (ex Cha et al. 2016)]|uniref:Glycine-rich protein n=2 Tax=Deinococcus soli (ex Cha et al. 2016) TaxID=1309411 RepID=A0AAE3XEF5_9DEIO|nr:hypothetical protein [Deinococcus soli (ex Cha et al. 2016)]MDR6219024.1 hypothetical protein [Deinococcus soli (ex Cha et al. 2016)]MDR6328821.1 hypothetical protein [Deinococcus soli (ex Cha et al. 2016)]MDR6751691.1 hypothetical protein [Deinococcus soli (ex Cha et al. 2016)]